MCTLEVISGGGKALQGLYVLVCVCVCVLPSRLVLGNFYSVWTSTDVKKSFQFRFSFPQLCNEDKNAQTKQIQISPTD